MAILVTDAHPRSIYGEGREGPQNVKQRRGAHHFLGSVIQLDRLSALRAVFLLFKIFILDSVMTIESYQSKDRVIVVYTGEGKGKTSASLGLMCRALGNNWRVAYIQFIKVWDVSEHAFIEKIMPLFTEQLDFYKGGLGFYEAGELSSNASDDEHKTFARKTYEFAYLAATSGEYNLVICDEINNAIHDGLLDLADLEKLITNVNPKTSLCLSGRYFPEQLIDQVDIATDMTKLKHHFDDKFIANKGIDY